MADLGPKILPNKKERWGEIGAFRKKSVLKNPFASSFWGSWKKKSFFWGGPPY